MLRFWKRHCGLEYVPAFSFLFSFISFLGLASAAESCTYQPLTEYGFALVDHSYQSFIADRLASCYIACNMQPACQSLNYNLADKTCEFNNDTKYFRPKYFVEKPTSVYGTNPDSERPWRKLNSAAVCFGARNDQFGRFEVEVGGSLDAVKLVHLSGLVNCNINRNNKSSKWGCSPYSKKIQVVITNTSNTVLLPHAGVNLKYAIPGYGPNSSEIVFSDFPNPLPLSSGQDLRLWHLYGLNNHTAGIRGGKSCANIFAKYMN